MADAAEVIVARVDLLPGECLGLAGSSALLLDAGILKKDWMEELGSMLSDDCYQQDFILQTEQQTNIFQ